MAYDKIVDSGVLDGKLTAIADAIRGKTGGTDELTLEQMATEIEGIQAGGGGDTAMEDGLVARTLTEYTNERVQSVGNNGLANFPQLTDLSLPNVENADNYAFAGNRKLVYVYLPKLKQFSTWGFQNDSTLERVTLPSLENMGMYGFEGCSKLAFADLSFENSKNDNWGIGDRSFNKTSLSTLVLRRSRLVPLTNVNAFGSTPFASGGTGGTVYVPSALIESYQTATNWSTLYAAGTCNFVAIEGSEYE